jgi:hypothetical protein
MKSVVKTWQQVLEHKVTSTNVKKLKSLKAQAKQGIATQRASNRSQGSGKKYARK